MLGGGLILEVCKRQKLRNIEYYNIQSVYDGLYSRAKKGSSFNKLYEIIISRENILLAYRNLKKNSGSTTKGTDNQNIKDLEKLSTEQLVNYVKHRLYNYYPKSVRRVYIPKANGKKRPLGIPTIGDRLIQQCILQVMEPICEAKFYNYSYGFRPNRNTKHAMARCYALAQINKLTFCVDVDLKGFFDNVDHAKLLKQLWTLGIQDKRLICIISKMLKAEIKDEGIPNKGTPQGGILSPLLANVVLNELDWWIASQWDEVPSKFAFRQKGNKHVALRNTNLKEMHIVRYADDFKIFCKSLDDAERIYNAITDWLKERLNLEINTDKSKIVDLTRNYSEYLGIKFKLVKKNGKLIVRSRICDKAKKRIVSDIKHMVGKIRKYDYMEYVNRLNAMILGYHSYYDMATLISQDFAIIQHRTYKKMKNRRIRTPSGRTPQVIKDRYWMYNGRKVFLRKLEIIPVYGVKFRTPMQFGKGISSYTAEGRAKIHKLLDSNLTKRIIYIMNNPSINYSVEYNDNSISLYSGQRGICAITKIFLEPWEMHCHHKNPRHLGGTDEYKNLIYINSEVHKLIHATTKETIERLINQLKLSDEQLKKVNNLRKLAELEEII